MSLEQYKITTYEDNVKDLPDYPSDAGITAKMLKEIFDGRTDKEVKEKVNALIDELIRKFAEVGVDISGKVSKEQGKGLSSNDFTEDYRIMVENADMAAADAGNEICQHKEDYENPHKVTAEQVGAYTKGEIDNFRIADEMHMEQHVGMRLDESLGDIRTALDELHAYAETLKGGDAE